MNNESTDPSFTLTGSTWLWLLLAGLLWVGISLWAFGIFDGAGFSVLSTASQREGDTTTLQQIVDDDRLQASPTQTETDATGSGQALQIAEDAAQVLAQEQAQAEQVAREAAVAESARLADTERVRAEQAAAREEQETARLAELEEARLAEEAAEQQAAEIERLAELQVETARAEQESLRLAEQEKERAEEQALRAAAEQEAAIVAAQVKAQLEKAAGVAAAEEAARVSDRLKAQAELDPPSALGGEDAIPETQLTPAQAREAAAQEARRVSALLQAREPQQTGSEQLQAEAGGQSANEAETYAPARLSEISEQQNIDAAAARAATNEAARVAEIAETMSAYEKLKAEELGTLPSLSGRLRFSSGSSTLTSNMERTLDRMFAPLFLYSEAEAMVSVASNDSNVAASNNALSLERGRAIVKYLIDRGLEKDRFRIQITADEQLPSGAHRVRVFVRESG